MLTKKQSSKTLEDAIINPETFGENSHYIEKKESEIKFINP